MTHWRFTLLALILALPPASVWAQKISKDTMLSKGEKRTYYLYAPRKVQPSAPVPLVVLLHGSSRVGLSLAEKWNELAEREGFIIVAPDSADSSHWAVPADGPAFVHDLVELVKSKYPINAKRVYLFGHSAGAVFALIMSLYESEYFAATAIHAGALHPDAVSLIELAKRKTPIHIQVGTVDRFFPLNVVRATRDLLNSRGFSVQLVEMPKHDHWYYDLAPKINEASWEFLKTHELPAEPHFEQYTFKTEGGSRSKEAFAQLSRGLERMQSGDLKAAITAYTRAIELDPKFADAYNNRGIAYQAQQDDPAALADFTRSIELTPTDAAYNNRGSILFAQRRNEEAIADFAAAIKLKPTAEAYTNRGTVYQQTKQYELALADYQRAIELNARAARTYILRGLLLLQTGQAADAATDLDKGFQLDPSLHAEFDPMIKLLRPKQ